MISGSLDINTLALLVLGAMTLLNTYYIRKTEKNTNSMKDALVKATGEASHAAGVEVGRTEGIQTAATLAAAAINRSDKDK